MLQANSFLKFNALVLIATLVMGQAIPAGAADVITTPSEQGGMVPVIPVVPGQPPVQTQAAHPGQSQVPANQPANTMSFLMNNSPLAPAAAAQTETTTVYNAPSNSNFDFSIVQTDGKQAIYLRNKQTGVSLLVTTINTSEKAENLDVDPSGKFALVNVTGTNLAKGGYLLLYDITKKQIAKMADPWGNPAIGSLPGRVYDNCNCNATPYRFFDGIILVNMQEPPDASGYVRQRGFILNTNLATPRFTETGPMILNGGTLLTPQKDKLVFVPQFIDYVHSWVAIYDVATGRTTFPAHPSGGFGGIKALTADGEFALIATNTLEIHAVSVRNRQIPDRYVVVNPPPGQAVSDCRLASIRFISSTVAEGTLKNGEKVLLYITAQNFSIVQPARTIVAPTNVNFSFVTKHTMQGQDLFIKDNRTGTLTFLTSARFQESILSFDVDPSGKYALYNIYGTMHAKNGYTRVFNLATKSYANLNDAVTGQSVSRLQGVLYMSTQLQTLSAFKFADGFVLFSFHEGGFTNAGGMVLNLRNVPVRFTKTTFIEIGKPVVSTPQKDKLLFGGQSGIGIYDIATNRLTYRASEGIIIKAVSSDGKFTITASQENKIYAVSIQNSQQATRSVTVPLDCNGGYVCWLSRLNYALEQARFVSPTLVEGTLLNGKKIFLYIDANRFEILPAQISPNPAMTTRDLRPLPTTQIAGKAFPQVTQIAPAGATANASSVNRGGYLYYDTKAAGWAGGGLTYDDFTTAGIETGNLSGLSQLTFGFKGSSSEIKLEIVDKDNRKSSVKLTGIRADQEQIWSISTSLFTGVDLSQVRTIYLIVEGQNKAGSLEFFHYPAGSSLPLMPNYFSTADITNLPGHLEKDHMAPPGADSGGPGTDRGAIFNFTTGTGGWAAGGFRYDNFQTPQIETGDLSQFKYLIFGLKGSVPQVKFEVVDDQGRKTSIYLKGIRPDIEQVWMIDTATIASYGVDLKKVRALWFVVEGQNQTGSIEINRRPTALNPSTIHNSRNINVPGNPSNTTVAPAGATANAAGINRGMRLTYDTKTAGWAGAGFNFDNPSTPVVETVDLSTFTPLVIGLKGNPGKVKFEVVDELGKKASVQLGGIRSDAEQVWAISTVGLANYGVNMKRIRFIFVIVEGVNQAGNLEIYRLPIAV